ncbi:MAG: hypothetical protein NC453_11055 [Muribaculum sp.]|nr:hypothetical protein [Muribaculum sp.]
MDEYRKTSFLMELAPDTYQFLKGLKPIALLYALVLAVMIALSMFFQWSVIKFFIDCMMGWTLLSIPFVGIIIVALDKEIQVKDYEFDIHSHHKSHSYKLSTIWGIVLCLTGLVGLYCSHSYKKYYGFQCQDFYLERVSGVYHILDDCEYIGVDSNDESIENPDLIKISGKELLDTDYELCVACEEWAEEAEAEAATYQYRRR